MKINKVLIKGIMAAMMGAFLMVPFMSSVSAEQGSAAPATGAVAADENGAAIVEVSLPIKYTSQRYGYTIMCPSTPNVVPASFFDEEAKGDVLIFEGDIDNIKKGWVILINAYEDGDIPANAGTATDEERKAILDKFADKYILVNTRVVEVAENTFGIYGYTPKELKVDTTGTGTMETVTTESQMIKTYMPGEFGGHFMISLVDNPDLSLAGIATYNAALTTFKQWPTSEYQQFLELSKLPKKKKK